jgi:DNA-binding response OmpR family regulator
MSMQNAPKRILVVDDEPDILEFLQVILEEEGYAVLTSDKGEFLEQLHNGGLPHLILLDVLLSGKDGREIVKYLKSQEETKSIPVIMFSAHPSAEETARQAGADDFLAKPFHIDVLLAKIAHYL